MEIVGPVVGIGSLITLVVAGVVAIRVVSSKFPTRHRAAIGDAERDQVIEDLQARVAELERLKDQMAELEERVDFAERMLARQRETPRVGPG
ncbi:MAG: hypothetical protein R2909_10110 [Gemmatimonadales bacterium]